jgi:recombination protein RecR
LEQRLAEAEIKEIIIATNPTVEGEATAHYIGEMARAVGIHVTRIAHGVPLGGELEYIDSGTLAHAFSGRQEL